MVSIMPEWEVCGNEMSDIWHRPTTNVFTGDCAENKKLPLNGQCKFYRQWLVVESD